MEKTVLVLLAIVCVIVLLGIVVYYQRKDDRMYWIKKATMYALWDSRYEDPDSEEHLPKKVHEHYREQYDYFINMKRNNPEAYANARVKED